MPRFSSYDLSNFARQNDWAIDAFNGDNNADGTRRHPLRDHAALMQRIGRLTGFSVCAAGKVTVALLSGLSPNDPMKVDLDIEAGTLVHYQGQQNFQMVSSNAAGIIPYAGNTQWGFFDASQAWSSFLPMGTRPIGRIIGGPRQGATFWTVRDMGGGYVRISHPVNAGPVAFPYNPNGGGIAFPGLGEGDMYGIFQLTPVPRFRVDIQTVFDFSQGNWRALVFENIAFGMGGIWQVCCPGKQPVEFVNCDMGFTNPSGCSIEAIGCSHSLVQPFPGIYIITGGVIRDAYVAIESGSQLELNSTVVQGSDLSAMGGGIIYNGDVGVFDGPGIRAMFGGEIHAGYKKTYGSGNAVGIDAITGRFAYRGAAAKPTIEGAVPFRVGGLVKTAAELPFRDEGAARTGSGIIMEG
jgi:hypothetical protein